MEVPRKISYVSGSLSGSVQFHERMFAGVTPDSLITGFGSEGRFGDLLVKGIYFTHLMLNPFPLLKSGGSPRNAIVPAGREESNR